MANGNSDSWVLDPCGHFAAWIIKIFLVPGKHVVKDSIVVNNEIAIPDLQRTLLLLFSRQGWLSGAVIFGIILALSSLPLFCILLKREADRRKRPSELDVVNSEEQLRLSVSSEAVEYRKQNKSKAKTIVLSTVIIASAAIVVLAAFGLLLCSIRLNKLRVQASDLADAAVKSIHEAADNLQDDVRKTLDALSSAAANWTHNSTITHMIEKKMEEINSNVKRLSQVGEMTDMYEKFHTEFPEIKKNVPDNETEIVELENISPALQEKLKQLLSNSDLKNVRGVKELSKEIAELPKLDIKSGLEELRNAFESTVKTAEAYKKSISSAMTNINQTVENTERLNSLLNGRISDIVAQLARASNETLQKINQKFQLFSHGVDTLLKNKTAENMRLWEGYLFKTVSAMDGRVLSAVLLSIAVAVLLIAIAVVIGWAVGAAYTECFNNCSTKEYFTSRTASRGGSLMKAGAYTTSLILWLLFAILFVSFAVGLYHVDACSSFENYDILDFRLGALLCFAKGGEIDVNRTVKAVMTKCRHSGNILEAVGREDLLMVNLSDFDIGQPDNTSSVTIMSIDISALSQAAERAASLNEEVEDFGQVLHKIKLRNYVSAFFDVKEWWEKENTKTKYPILVDNKDVYNKLAATGIKIKSIFDKLHKARTQRHNAQDEIDTVSKFLKNSTEVAENLKPYIGKSEGEFLNAFTTSYLREMDEHMNSILNGAEVDHSTCVTILREYDRAKSFACNKLLIVVAATWLMCLLITVFLALQMSASFPASRLFTTEVLKLDAIDMSSFQQRSEVEEDRMDLEDGDEASVHA